MYLGTTYDGVTIRDGLDFLGLGFNYMEGEMLLSNITAESRNNFWSCQTELEVIRRRRDFDSSGRVGQ